MQKSMALLLKFEPLFEKPIVQTLLFRLMKLEASIFQLKSLYRKVIILHF